MDVLTVIYLTWKAHNGRLTPLSFSLVLSLGFSFVVSSILLITMGAESGNDLRKTGFVILVFLVNFLVGFPVAYFLSKFLLRKSFSKWSSQINEPKGD